MTDNLIMEFCSLGFVKGQFEEIFFQIPQGFGVYKMILEKHGSNEDMGCTK